MANMMKSLLKGWFGETMTNFVSWIALDDGIYHRLNNVTLPKHHGMTTQIDHIIVSQYGIFVIETKNYQGWIFGNEKQEKWTQVVRGGKKFQFYNPIRQNYGHIKTLSDLLQLDLAYFHSIIWFASNSELKTKDELPDFVLNRGLISYIKTKNKIILSQEQVLMIVKNIKENKFDNGLGTYFMHRANVRRHIEQKKNSPTCPKCQSMMVKRVAKNGDDKNKAFWGCTRYPKCRGTRPMD